jgi:hypothetical protein
MRCGARSLKRLHQMLGMLEQRISIAGRDEAGRKSGRYEVDYRKVLVPGTLFEILLPKVGLEQLLREIGELSFPRYQAQIVGSTKEKYPNAPAA